MSSPLSHPLLAGLGLTVLHALWEFLVLALLAQLGLRVLRGRSASLQYVWAGACLLAMGAAFGLTAWLLLSLPGLGPAPVLGPSGGELGKALLPSGGLGASMALVGVLSPWLALGWIAGALLMGIRLGGAMVRVDRVLRRGATAAPALLEARVRVLARRMGLNPPVRLLLREGIGSPAAFGWIRPVILLPAAALAQIPPEALEAVIAHELAHLVRRDYLANLVQSFLESLLFFHPAVWWLSRRVRELREHACDDLAVRLTGDPLPLAEGLHAFERLRHRLQSVPHPALAAAKGPVMSRITRLLMPSATPVPSWRIPLALLIAGSLLGATALATRVHAEAPPKAASKTHGLINVILQREEGSQVKLTYQPPPPPYPAKAREAGLQGTVVAHLQVDPAGQVAVTRVEGPEGLQEVAKAYAPGFRFEASERGGGASLTLIFQLVPDKAGK